LASRRNAEPFEAQGKLKPGLYRRENEPMAE
jgi:hypothetical protein